MKNVTQEEESCIISRNNQLHSQTFSKQCQQFDCNVYDYVKENKLGIGLVRETAKVVNIKYCKADSYYEMSGKIFENWFKYTLT
ncbi:hypothetical protein C0J52_05138 [Blattella germanica]|nr:hypothetical protein C0J52_05138 [Blattella germanica]